MSGMLVGEVYSGGRHGRLTSQMLRTVGDDTGAPGASLCERSQEVCMVMMFPEVWRSQIMEVIYPRSHGGMEVFFQATWSLKS